MPWPKSPETIILEQMAAIADAAQLHLVFDMDTPFVVRHFRNRRGKGSERPGVALRYVGTEIPPNMGQSSSEMIWAMTVDIVVDLELDPEEDGVDVTGWDKLTAAARAFAALYLSMESPLRNFVDDILPGELDPDEDSTPDDGRLVQSVSVLYRTPWNDQQTLLTPAENVI